MAEDLIFYTNPMSRGRIVRWLLEEIGEPYQTEVVFYGEPMKSGGYRAINPMGKVPALRHGDQIVTETAAICAYLADAFPQAGLAPPLAQRGSYYRWMFFVAGPLEAAVANKVLGVEVPDGKRGFVGYGSFDEAEAAIRQAVAGDAHVLGDQFTALDVYLGGQIGFGMQFGTLTRHPEFEAYFARLSARPAYQRANEIDDALMPDAS